MNKGINLNQSTFDFYKFKIICFTFIFYFSFLSFCFGLPNNIDGLDQKAKNKIDLAVKNLSLVNANEDKKIFKGNIINWIINQCYVSEKEELDGVLEWHEKIKMSVSFSTTPSELNLAFKNLVSNIPPNLKYEKFDYQIFVIDQPELKVFTNGGGYVYITKGLLEKYLDSKNKPTPALYFILANELGKISHKQTRRGYQLIEFEKELKRLINLNINDDIYKVILQTSLNPVISSIKFLFTPHQVYQADYFALYLCRNSGVKLNDSLDALRFFVLDKYPKILEKDLNVGRDFVEESFNSDPLVRLNRMLNEIGGVVDQSSKKFGLFQCVDDGNFKFCDDKSVAGDEYTMVLCHGLKGNEETFKDFIKVIRKDKVLKDRSLLVFRYPNNQSLSRSGQFLFNEMRRVFKDSKKSQFICHSAGGLIFRHYAEINNGLYSQAFFIATPHKGSDMVKFKFLIDSNDFLKSMGLDGLPRAILDAIPEGNGEIGFDLQPKSLFLSNLNSIDSSKRNYFILNAIYSGISLTNQGGAKNKALLFALENTIIPALKNVLRDRAGQIGSPLLKKWAFEVIEQIALPEEVKNGDIAVSFESSMISGIKVISTRFGLNHIEILKDTSVIDEVIKKLVVDK